MASHKDVCAPRHLKCLRGHRSNDCKISIEMKNGEPSYGSPNSDLVARTGFEPVISALRGRRPEPLDERAKSETSAHGWDGGSRTPIDGTRIRCPAIRRHPKVMRVTPQREETLYGNVPRRASPNRKDFELCGHFEDTPAHIVNPRCRRSQPHMRITPM